MPTKRAAAKPAKPKKAEKPKLTAKKPATETRRSQIAAKPVAGESACRREAALARSPSTRAHSPLSAEPAASATPVAQAIRKARAVRAHRRDGERRAVSRPVSAAPPRAAADDDADDDERRRQPARGPSQRNAVHRQAWRGVHEQCAARPLQQHPERLEARPDGRSRPHRLSHERRSGRISRIRTTAPRRKKSSASSCARAIANAS